MPIEVDLKGYEDGPGKDADVGTINGKKLPCAFGNMEYNQSDELLVKSGFVR